MEHRSFMQIQLEMDLNSDQSVDTSANLIQFCCLLSEPATHALC